MFDLSPIGTVRCTRTTPEDDHWAGTTATIELAPGIPAESLSAHRGSKRSTGTARSSVDDPP